MSQPAAGKDGEAGRLISDLVKQLEFSSRLSDQRDLISRLSMHSRSSSQVIFLANCSAVIPI